MENIPPVIDICGISDKKFIEVCSVELEKWFCGLCNLR